MYEENFIHESQELVLNEKIKSDLQPTAKWTKIYFYFMCVTIVLLILGLPVLLFSSDEFISERAPSVPTEGLGFVWAFAIVFLLVLVGIIAYLASKVKRFADSMKEVCLTGSSDEAQRGFAAMKSYFRFNGILCIVLICLIAAPIILALLAFFLEGFVRRLTEV